jgi:uncharacterized protein (DUF433 family)
MSREELIQHISINPNVCFGKPVIRGTRIWVSLIVNYLAMGSTIESILTEYPQITTEDARACLSYAAELTQGSDFEVPLEAA